MTRRIIALACFIGLSCSLEANVSLPRFFSNHMVLQRHDDIIIYGWAQPGENITTTFKSEEKSTVADQKGNWSLTFKPANAGGPFNIQITGNNTIKLSDIYIGDVWLCSGQSNMGWRLENAQNGAQEVANAEYEQIKLLNVSREMASAPKTNISKGSWKTCTPKNTKKFSAVAYFFGRELYKKYKVPIGLIHTSWGGTNIEAWMSEELFGGDAKRQLIIQKMKTIALSKVIPEYKASNIAYGEMLDEEDLGDADSWESIDTNYGKKWKPFELPSLWKNTELPKTYGVVWVTKTVNLEASDISSDVQLSLGRIDNEDITYVNGQRVGASIKKDLDRFYSIPKEVLAAGENRVTVRSKNLGSLGGFRGAVDDLYLETNSRKISLSGKWLYRVGTPDVEKPPTQEHPKNYPSSLYNSMIHPFFGYNIRGIIWYQGESNAKNPEEYAKFFPKMIEHWRSKWNKEVPFLFVQIANYANQRNRYPWLRESQTAALVLDHTAMVTTIDIGNDANIHPINKQDVGLRLAYAARNIVYGDDDIPSCGPKVKKVERTDDKLLVTFDSPFVIRGNQHFINGFQISDRSENFVDAKANLLNPNTIQVSNSEVVKPKFLRYLWEDAPGDVMIYNEQGLPTAPFRTDTGSLGVKK